MTTAKKIKEGCETCQSNYNFEKKRGTLNMWKLRKCEWCGRELQPEDVGVKTKDGELYRVCLYCEFEVKV